MMNDSLEVNMLPTVLTTPGIRKQRSLHEAYNASENSVVT